jgi:hypothetical protein
VLPQIAHSKEKMVRRLKTCRLFTGQREHAPFMHGPAAPNSVKPWGECGIHLALTPNHLRESGLHYSTVNLHPHP